MDPRPNPPSSTRPSRRVQRILNILKFRKEGRPIVAGPWKAYRLDLNEFDELQRWLKKDEALWGYIEDKVRYDYDPKQGILVSRMPTQLHSIFISSVVTEIRRRLDSIAENGDTISKAFSREIVPMASARIDLLGLEEEDGKQKIRHDPDFSFQHLEAQWAGVVLELSYPEKRRALPHLADDYILGSGGNVRILVALDLDTNTKAVTISTWRPILVKGNQEEAIHLEVALTIDREVFRDEFGNPNPDPNAGLRLNLEDFGPQCLTEGLPAETSVFIDAATLSRTLTRAEHESMVKEDCGSQIRKPNTQ